MPALSASAASPDEAGEPPSTSQHTSSSASQSSNPTSRLKRLRSRLPGRRGRGAATAEERDDRTPWRCLRYPSMAWWSGANLVSNIGTWMQLTVQNLLVLQVTGSAATTGLSVAVQAAPGLLLSLVGGAAVDRWPRKLTASVSQAVLGLVAFATAALVALDMLNVPLLMVLAAATGIIATVDNPACTLLGNDLVRSEDVPSAIALGSVVHSVGRLIGAAAAGGAVAWFGLASAYVVNGVSFLVVASVIPFLKTVAKDPPPGVTDPAPAQARPEPAKAARRPNPLVETRDGLAFFLRRPRLVALTAVTGISAMFGRNYGLTLAVLVTGPLAGGAGSFGTVSTVLAVGGMIGAVAAGCLRKPSVTQVAVLAAVGAGLQIAAGLVPSLALLLVLVVPMSVAESVSDTVGTTVLQTDPPAHMRGRVLGVWRSVSTGWRLVGPPLLGALMELAGARGALIVGGLVILAVTGAAGLYRSRRAVGVASVPAQRGPAPHVPGPREPATAEQPALTPAA